MDIGERILRHFFRISGKGNGNYPGSSYFFDNFDEFKNYFINAGCINISSKELDYCNFITRDNGKIIALKEYCDYVIDQYKKRRTINYDGFTSLDDYIDIFGLIEEPDKEYTAYECADNIVYVFNNMADFRNYFVSNGCYSISDEQLNICIIFRFSTGLIVAIKRVCDKTITNHIRLNKSKKLELRK